MIELYQSYTSTCSGKVRLVLEEKGLPYTEIPVNLGAGEQHERDYLKLNPKAVVPTLIHDGEVLCESTLICEYLDETFPEPPLVPADPVARARMRLWPKTIDEEKHPATNVITYFVGLIGNQGQDMSEEEIEARFAAMPDKAKVERQREVLRDGVKSRQFIAAVRMMDKLLSEIDEALESGGGLWIMGDTYTLADVCVTPYVLRLEMIGFDGMWQGRRRHLNDWWERITARPNFRGAISPDTPEDIKAMRREAGAKIWPDVEKILDAA